MQRSCGRVPRCLRLFLALLMLPPYPRSTIVFAVTSCGFFAHVLHPSGSPWDSRSDTQSTGIWSYSALALNTSRRCSWHQRCGPFWLWPGQASVFSSLSIPVQRVGQPKVADSRSGYHVSALFVITTHGRAFSLAFGMIGNGLVFNGPLDKLAQYPGQALIVRQQILHISNLQLTGICH